MITEGDYQISHPSCLTQVGKKEQEGKEGKLGGALCHESSLGFPQTEAPGISSARLELLEPRLNGSPPLGTVSPATGKHLCLLRVKESHGLRGARIPWTLTSASVLERLEVGGSRAFISACDAVA